MCLCGVDKQEGLTCTQAFRLLDVSPFSTRFFLCFVLRVRRPVDHLSSKAKSADANKDRPKDDPMDEDKDDDEEEEDEEAERTGTDRAVSCIIAIFQYMCRVCPFSSFGY